MPKIKNYKKNISIWLFSGVFMLLIQIVLGSVTRLTDSGLSITEWKPLLGALPPLHESEWQVAFYNYQKIAQFKFLNAHFLLADFKRIFFWEWLHREWARLMGLVFLVGFIYFLVTKSIPKKFVSAFVILFLLGALQGVIGWVMVQSGLNETDLYVSHIRLAVHFLAALLLLGYVFRLALNFSSINEKRILNITFKRNFLILLSLLTIQLLFGAFMSGLKAASSAPTWPSINGFWLPNAIHQYGNRTFTFSSAIVNNPIVVQFIHRSLAYIISLFIILNTLQISKFIKQKSLPGLKKIYLWPLVLVIFQVILGVLTVLNAGKTVPQHWGSFEWLAEIHQFMAILLLLSLLLNYYMVSKQSQN